MNLKSISIGCILVVALAPGVKSQTNNGLQQGLAPYESLQGGSIDTITMSSGGLYVHIPLLNYPQRGGVLKLSFSLQSNNKTWWVQSSCPQGQTCTHGWVMQNNAILLASPTPSMGPVDDQVWLGGVIMSGDCHKGEGTYSTFALGPTGDSHQMAFTSGTPPGSACGGTQATIYTADGMGVKYVGPNNSSNYKVYAGTGKIIDRDGIIYPAPTSSLFSTLREDPNGNQISLSISTSNSYEYVDTLGRSIPMPPGQAIPILQNGATQNPTTTNYSGCTGPLPISSATLWNPPGPNGSSVTYKFCYVNIQLQTNFGVASVSEGSGTFVFLQSLVLPNGTTWTFEYNSRSAGDSQSINYGDLTKITFPTGGSINYAYANEIFCYHWAVGPCPSGYPTVPSRAVISRSVNANDGTGAHTWSYSWGTVTGTTSQTMTDVVTDPLGNDSVHLMTGFDMWRETQTQFFQGTHSSGTLLKTVNVDWSPYSGPSSTDPHSVLPIRSTTTWANNNVAKVEMDYDFGISWINGYNSAASYGNVIAKREYDYGNGASGPIVRTTNTTFMALNGPNASSYLANNLLSLPYTVQILNGSGTQYASTRYGYDESSLGSSGVGSTEQHDTAPPTGTYRGNQTSTLRWLNSGTLTCQNGHSAGTGSNVTSKITYFDTGTVQSSSDPCGNTTSFLYSNNYWGAYPTTVTNALSQVTGHTYDFNTGLLTSTTDPNNLVTSYGYDSMWRIASVANPDGGGESINRQELSFPFTATLITKINSSLTKSETNVFDGLGRPYQHQLSDQLQGTIYTDTTYDTVGRISTVSNPHRTCGTDITSSCGITTYGYDALNRKTSESYPDGSVLQTAYCGPSTLVTDPTNRWRRSRVDGLGRLVEVDEPNAVGATVASTGCPGTGEAIWVTSYTIDALGNLTNVLQNGSHPRSFTYDSLSRLQCSSNPETATTACPAFGATAFPTGTLAYVYNPDGIVTKKTDARSISTTYAYDALHRELTRTYSDGTSTVTTAYDQAACLGLSACQNIGRRTSVTDAGSELWAYQVDPANLRDLHREQRTTNSITKTTTYLFDLAGNTSQITYPTGRIVNYSFDSANRPSLAQDSSNGITYATGFQSSPGGTCVANVTCYTPQGSVYVVSLGQTSSFTGLNVTNIYNSRLEPLEFKSSSTGGTAIDITYSYADPLNNNKNAGHVFSITNNLNSARTQSFTYDQVNRITSAGTFATTGPYCWGYQYSYDGAWGNLTSQAGWTPNYTGCTQTVMAAVTADGNNHISAFSYDAAGNATGETGFTYAWDAESQLKSAGGVNYTYDDDGRRVAKVGSKLYWYGSGNEILAETDAAGNTLNEYIFFGGKRVAILPAGSTAQYYVEDSLGSSRIVTSNTGVVCYDADFYPFGGERAVTSTCTQNNYKFEGKERDAETSTVPGNANGNDEFGARYYSNRFGRWLSADWANISAPVPYANLSNPQSLNLYSIVTDDPESFADLDGHGGNGGSDFSPLGDAWQFSSANNLWVVNGHLWSPNGGTAPTTVFENIIWDTGSNGSKPVTAADKAKFGKMQEETAALYERVNINLSVEYHDGYIDWTGGGYPADVIGSKIGSLNVFVFSGRVPLGIIGVWGDGSGSAGIQFGKAFAFIGLSEAQHWTLSHEFAHHFLGDTRGKAGIWQKIWQNTVGDSYINLFVLPHITSFGETLRQNASSPCFTGGGCQ
jgi:RHS repeat-associated protein